MATRRRETEEISSVTLKYFNHVLKTGRCYGDSNITVLTCSNVQEIETWVAALAHYDNNEFDEALKTFEVISDTSKILFNCGVIHATLGEHEKAVSSMLATEAYKMG